MLVCSRSTLAPRHILRRALLVPSALTSSPPSTFRSYRRGLASANSDSNPDPTGPLGKSKVDWTCTHTWSTASVNTAWCLLGCSIGEFGTIAAFQLYYGGAFTPTLLTIVAPVVNGLITSVALETVILHKGAAQMPLNTAFQTATGMSFISMCVMEFAMELSDFCLTGGSFAFQLWLVPPVLFSGFVAALPYNYWRLKKYGKACH